MKKRDKVVLTGGCFDILHPGHIIFLEKAKQSGDYLIVLLESDEKIKKIKGNNRPILSQKDRMKILQSLRSVDEVINLPFFDSAKEYDQFIEKIKPDIIAVTKGYPNISYYLRSAKSVGAKLKFVTPIIGNYSTSKITSCIKKKF